ncbi:45155_t:CDS:2 [Gigaspora margarita]|uniref:45155_t:CDS:1 n=1 Tax=Gigaspora margarita TaxID=4874 RepID=A0ABN7VB25_GIGMA|nr:45155_t:CDS:2 [Gigaspora margarita]
MEYKTFNFFLIALSLSLLVLTINANTHTPIRFNKHANVHRPTPCQARGNPGWNDLGYIPLGYYDFLVGTPQECCNSSITKQSCFEWYFNPINGDCTIVISNPCSGATYSMSCVGLEGGSVRCSDSSNW